MIAYTATYSPEDNKLRLYASQRLDADTYARIKAAGFKWAPKQELFVAPAWSPDREDLLLELAGEIEAEQMTLAERAAAKAERLEGLAQKRTRDANRFSEAAASISERFAGGQPILIGHHSERRARRDRKRVDSAMSNSVKAAKAADHWLYKASGVERNANYKALPSVRARRIKTLLAELRTLQRNFAQAEHHLALWRKIEAANPTAEQLRAIVGGMDFRATGPYGAIAALDRGEITAADYIARRLSENEATLKSQRLARWFEHTLNRLAYERAELGPVERFTGDLTAVTLQAFAREQGAESPKAKQTDYGWLLSSPVTLPAHVGDGRELELTADEWRDLMQGVGYAVAVREPKKRGKSTAPPLINPSAEEAVRLQALWNAQAAERSARRDSVPVPVTNVRNLTQAAYSANSGATYSVFQTVNLDANGKRIWPSYQRMSEREPAACRVRVGPRGDSSFYAAESVIRITDKPSAPLPIQWPEPVADQKAA